MVSIKDIVTAKGITIHSPASYESTGLPYNCTCFECNKNLSPDTAYPANNMKIKCIDHIRGNGFRTPEQFEKYIAVYSLHKRDRS
jgi:hypothetical protein